MFLHILFIVLGAFAYFVIAGFTHRAAEMSHRSKCGRCSSNQGGKTCTDDPEIAWFCAALFCALVIPAFIGMKLYGGGGVNRTRQERRHEKEMRQAEHMSNLAKLRLKEAQDLQKASELTEPQNILNLLSK